MDEIPVRRRRRRREGDTQNKSTEEFLIPLVNGRRIRGGRVSNYEPGTVVYVTMSEYIALNKAKANKEEPAADSPLDEVAEETLRPRRRRRGAPSPLSVAPSAPAQSPTKAEAIKSLPHPINTQRAEIKTLATEIANQTAQQFLKDCLPPSLLASLSKEQLYAQQQELSAEIANSLKSQLAWALNRAWLDAQNRTPSSFDF